MTVIVAGHIYVKAGMREQFLAGSLGAMQAARATAGCADFVVAADPIEGDRVNVFERWDSRATLMAFRESGPDDGLADMIVRAAVREYEI